MLEIRREIERRNNSRHNGPGGLVNKPRLPATLPYDPEKQMDKSMRVTGWEFSRPKAQQARLDYCIRPPGGGKSQDAGRK